MKTADLKTGVLYNLSTYTVPGYILDPNRQYSKEHFYSGYAKPKLKQPNFSGKGTHVLTLAKRGHYDSDRAFASDAEAAQYTLAQYREGVEAPYGWNVELATPTAIKGTWEEHEANVVADEERRKRAQAAYTAQVKEIEGLIAELKACGLDGPIHRNSTSTITLHLPEVRQIIKLLGDKK